MQPLAVFTLPGVEVRRSRQLLQDLRALMASAKKAKTLIAAKAITREEKSQHHARTKTGARGASLHGLCGR